MDKQVWERTQSESIKAHAAFLIFAGLPPAERSVNAAYRAKSGRESVKVAPGYWFQWSRDFSWESRAAALDKWKREQSLLAEGTEILDKRLQELEDERIRTLKQVTAGTTGAVKLLIRVVENIEKTDVSKLKPNQIGSLLVQIMTVFEKAAILSDRALHIEQLTQALQDKLAEKL